MDQKKIGAFIAETRKETGLTQETLSEKLGVSKNAVSKWERGLNLPDASIMQELCAALGITLNELFAGERLAEPQIPQQAEKNIMTIMTYEAERSRRRRLYYLALLLLLLLIIFLLSKPALVELGYAPDDELVYAQIYQPGEDNIKGEVDVMKFVRRDINFDIGANKYGYAVFKDPQTAFKCLKRDYAQGIALIQKEFKLPPLCNFTFRRYLTYGWQVTTGTAEEQEQAGFVSSFLDIYENSFR